MFHPLDTFADTPFLSIEPFNSLSGYILILAQKPLSFRFAAIYTLPQGYLVARVCIYVIYMRIRERERAPVKDCTLHV